MPSTLFLTQNAPPHAGAAARRIDTQVRRFAEEGPVYVIRRGGGGVAIPGAEGVFDVTAKDLRAVTGVGATVSNERKANPTVRAAARLRQAFPFVYLTDNGGPNYRSRAFKLACDLVEEQRINKVFSSFRPWSDHLVAARLKDRYPALRWIADFRDLPVDPVRRDVWFPPLQTWWGRRVIAGADEVWCVSEGQAAQLAGWHPNIRVVRNALLRLPPERSAPVTDRFTITYTGSLYPGLQTMEPVVQGLRRLLSAGQLSPQSLLLRYRGKDGPTFRKWCAGLPEACLDVQPNVAPAAAHKLQAKTTVNLLLNWSAEGYYGVLTAKLFDYLAAGRPILAYVNGPGDRELSAIVEGAYDRSGPHRAGAVFGRNEQAALERHLTDLVQEWQRTGTVATIPNRTFLRQLL